MIKISGKESDHQISNLFLHWTVVDVGVCCNCLWQRLILVMIWSSLCKLVGCSLKISNLYLYIYFMPICFSSLFFDVYNVWLTISAICFSCRCIHFIFAQDIPSQPWNLLPVKSKGWDGIRNWIKPYLFTQNFYDELYLMVISVCLLACLFLCNLKARKAIQDKALAFWSLPQD